MTPDDPRDEWWTTDDVATYAQITAGTIRAYVARHQMPEPERIGRSLVWRPDVIRAWRPRGEVQDTSPDVT